jgi:hypothetical protein
VEREGSHGQSISGSVTAHLCAGDVSLYVADHFLTRLDQQPYSEHVAHRAANREQAGLMAEKFRHPLLEFVHRRVLGVHIIAHWRGQHCLPHLLSWLGEGVRAQIDHGQESDGSESVGLVALVDLRASGRPRVPVWTSARTGTPCQRIKLHIRVPVSKRGRQELERGLREQILKSKRHVGLDRVGSLDAASGQALRDKEGELE